MELGKNILKARKRKGLSQEELGNKIGVTRQTISNWELGITGPNPNELKKISHELGISVDELLENDIKDIIVEKVNHTEKQSNMILLLVKTLLLILGIGLLIFGFLVVAKIISKNNRGPKREESIYCKIYGEEHSFNIVYEELTGIPLELGGDAYFNDILDLDKYNDAHQIFNIINDYVKKNGGTCEMIKERDLNNLVNIYIKEGTLTKTGATIVITENIDYDIIYGEDFWIEKYNYKTGLYDKLENTTNNNCAFNSMAYYASPNRPLELFQSWSCMYGELPKGNYRLVKDVFFESDIPVTSKDSYYIWVEFEIE